MVCDPQDKATISVLIKSLDRRCLPRIMDIRERDRSGEILSYFDISFLHELVDGTYLDRVLFFRHPELAPIMERLAELVKEITDRALTNERLSE